MEAVELTEEGIPGVQLTKDPTECSALELIRWLKCHGVKRTGRKQGLIDRVRGCIAMKKAVNPKIDHGKWYELRVTRLGNNLTTSRPHQSIPNQGWKVFPSFNIPQMFNYGHIYYGHMI